MDQLFQRWLESRSVVRLVCWCVVSAIFALAAWGLLVRPAWQKCTELDTLSRRAAHTNITLWPTARGFSPEPARGNTRPMPPFSPLELQGKTTRLVHWKPQHNGGELALEAMWSEVPTLFFRLAQQAVRIRAFNIVPAGERLRLSLQLETDRAQ